jgi:hypothetical protein
MQRIADLATMPLGGAWESGKTTGLRWHGFIKEALGQDKLPKLLAQVAKNLPTVAREDFEEELQKVRTKVLIEFAGKDWATLKKHIRTLTVAETTPERLTAARGIRNIAIELIDVLDEGIALPSVLLEGSSSASGATIQAALLSRSYNVLSTIDYMLSLPRSLPPEPQAIELESDSDAIEGRAPPIDVVPAFRPEHLSQTVVARMNVIRQARKLLEILGSQVLPSAAD